MKKPLTSLASPMVTRRAVLVATGVASLSVLVPRGLLAAEGAEKAFAGSYKHSGDKDQEARDKAIDDVVDGMNILVRSIAREKLKAATAIAAAVSIASDGTSLTISLDTRVYTAPLSGTSVKVTGITGDKLDLSYAVSAGKIEQRFAGDGGKGRVNTFTKSGDVLTMSVRVFSPQLPKDLKFKLTYKKS